MTETILPQAAVSLIVCNLLVIVTRLYRVIYPSEDDYGDDTYSSRHVRHERQDLSITRTRSSTVLTFTEISTQFLDLTDTSLDSGSVSQFVSHPDLVSSIPEVESSAKSEFNSR